MSQNPKQNRPCTLCQQPVRSRSLQPVCATCAPRRAVSDAESNRTPAWCEHCGRTHAGRWECVERSERSGEAVRLFLLERGDL